MNINNIMANINFPSSPTSGEIYTFNTRSWIWNGYAWDSYFDSANNVEPTIFLNDIIDVESPSPVVKRALIYNGNEWVDDVIENNIVKIDGGEYL